VRPTSPVLLYSPWVAALTSFFYLTHTHTHTHIAQTAAAVSTLPAQVSEILETRKQLRMRGGSFNHVNEAPLGFVVLCGGVINVLQLEHFLEDMITSENGSVFVVILSSKEPSNEIISLLKTPTYEAHTHYITGSSLNLYDLRRAQVDLARGIFIVSETTLAPKEADRSSLFRYWAVRNFAPHLPIYLQLCLMESKKHVSKADRHTVVLCMDEIRFAMLAQNCMCPGISTLIDHMMRGDRGLSLGDHGEPGSILHSYVKSLSNRLINAKLESHPFFAQFVGKSFSSLARASLKHNVTVVGIYSSSLHDVLLNPPHNMILDPHDEGLFLCPANFQYDPPSDLASVSDEDDDGCSSQGRRSSNETQQLQSGPRSDSDHDEPLRESKLAIEGATHIRRARRANGPTASVMSQGSVIVHGDDHPLPSSAAVATAAAAAAVSAGERATTLAGNAQDKKSGTGRDTRLSTGNLRDTKHLPASVQAGVMAAPTTTTAATTTAAAAGAAAGAGASASASTSAAPGKSPYLTGTQGEKSDEAAAAKTEPSPLSPIISVSSVPTGDNPPSPFVPPDGFVHESPHASQPRVSLSLPAAHHSPALPRTLSRSNSRSGLQGMDADQAQQALLLGNAAIALPDPILFHSSIVPKAGEGGEEEDNPELSWARRSLDHRRTHRRRELGSHLESLSGLPSARESMNDVSQVGLATQPASIHDSDVHLHLPHDRQTQSHHGSTEHLSHVSSHSDFRHAHHGIESGNLATLHQPPASNHSQSHHPTHSHHGSIHGSRGHHDHHNHHRVSTRSAHHDTHSAHHHPHHHGSLRGSTQHDTHHIDFHPRHDTLSHHNLDVHSQIHSDRDRPHHPLLQVILPRKLDAHALYHGSEPFNCHVLVHYHNVDGQPRQVDHFFRHDLRLTREHVEASTNFIIVRAVCLCLCVCVSVCLFFVCCCCCFVLGGGCVFFSV
jgi:hypothetical protein